ncbi:uncharacterized protein MAM_04630 [Metarhizium album ARSEF 1941]|uniref:Uncharacterized protein n=1 Tax=Metarhizium album (strain ARSEF 1941) TaxID=1081103 RepID=A0A0B2WXL9_METAS|nr:uncharacterized protein MAM_04630 [Metarhizium album ARSEF 1941]KHN97615.1 hypothetical protein MAM_04630 [Metarhizium album ARSEF 1941]
MAPEPSFAVAYIIAEEDPNCVYDGGAAPRWTRNLDRSQATSVDDHDGSPTERCGMSGGIATSKTDERASVSGSVSKVSDEAAEKGSAASEAASTSITGGTSQNGSNG